MFFKLALIVVAAYWVGSGVMAFWQELQKPNSRLSDINFVDGCTILGRCIYKGPRAKAKVIVDL